LRDTLGDDDISFIDDDDQDIVQRGGFDWSEVDVAPGRGWTPQSIDRASSSKNSTPTEDFGVSSQGSSASLGPSSKRRRRTVSPLDALSLQAVMDARCHCVEVSCTKKFNIGEIFGLRHERTKLAHGEDMDRRNRDLQAAAETDPTRCVMDIGRKCVCLMTYCLVLDINWSSMRRSWSRLTKGHHPPALGRPKNKSGDSLSSARSMDAYAWMKTWIEVFGDEDPVGVKYKYVINYVLASEIYEEYSREFYVNRITLESVPISLRSFTRVWTSFQKEEKVRVRRKANVTTKCQICDELYLRATDPKTTRAELAEIREARVAHHKDIHRLRQLYMSDTQRAKHDVTFQTIVFDGTNSNSCNCPQGWRSSVRGEKQDGTFVPQKIQSVLIHGRALIFYAVPPCVELGMNLTVSCLVDAMQYVDPRTRVIRFQYDGEQGSIFSHAVMRIDFFTSPVLSRWIRERKLWSADIYESSRANGYGGRGVLQQVAPRVSGSLLCCPTPPPHPPSFLPLVVTPHQIFALR